MTIYILLFIYLLAVDWTSPLFREKCRTFQLLAGGVGLWLVLAMRSPVCGIDLLQGESGSRNYYWMFEASKSMSWKDIIIYAQSERIEFGWFLLCKLISLLSSNFQAYLAVIAAIQIVLIAHILKRYSTDIVLSYIVYFTFGLYSMSFSGLRQATAYAITFFSIQYLLDHKKLKFVLTTLIASSLHYSALIFLIAWPLSKIKFNSRRSMGLIFFTLLFIPLLPFVAVWVSRLLFSSHYDIFRTINEGGAITMFVIYGAFLILGNKVIKDATNQVILWMIFMSYALQSLGVISNTYLTRIGFYFQMFFLLYFPLLLNCYFKRKNKWIIMTSGSMALFLFFYLTNKNSPLEIIPYYFFWEKPFLL